MFLNTWSQFQIPLILASSMDTKPMAIVVSEFVTKDSVEYGLIATAGYCIVDTTCSNSNYFQKVFNFWHGRRFCKRIIMTIQEVMLRIEIPEEVRENIGKYSLSEKEFYEWKHLFENDFEIFLNKWRETQKHFQWVLWFYLKLTCEVHEMYKEKDISEEIFHDTFSDITIWCKECYRKYKVYGLEEVEWVAKSIRMELFRLGRLQFEPLILDQKLAQKYHLPSGEKVLNVHIPAGEKLDYCECQKSFESAKKFFSNEDVIFICDSWLLSPELREILPETSNIIRFQKMYHIVEVHYDFPQAEERVFGEIQREQRCISGRK